MQVAHFGTFDVENYGDLLFPVVAKHFLSPLAPSFTFVSPMGGPPVCDGAEHTVGVLNVDWSKFDFDLALIGGGNIVTSRPTSLPVYAKQPSLGLVAYPSLWISPCIRASKIGAAVAWNAPGLQQEKWSKAQRHVLEGCVRYSDYVAFREGDFASRVLPDEAQFQLVPDPVIALSRVWPLQELASYSDANAEKWQLGGGYFVFHAKKRNLSTLKLQREAVAAIGKLAKSTGLKPVLLAIGRCHGDHEVLAVLSEALIVDHVLIDAALPLKEFTALIASASYVFSASLHGAIVAASYGTPVNLLGVSQLPKYQAFFRNHLRVEGVVVDSFTSLTRESLEAAKARSADMDQSVRLACGSVEQHYANIITSVTEKRDRTSAGATLGRHLRSARRLSSIGTVLPIETII